MSFGPRVVSEAAMQEIEARKAGIQQRTVFAEEFSQDRFVQIVVTGAWGEDMADAVTNFLARRSETLQQTLGA